MVGVVSRVMAPKDVYVLISWTCESVTLHSKRDLQMWLWWRSWDREIILNYLSEPNVITRVFIKQRSRRIRGDVMMEAGSRVSERDWKMLHCWLWRWRQGPKAKECRGPLESGGGKDMDSPLESPEEMHPDDTLILGPLNSRIVR